MHAAGYIDTYYTRTLLSDQPRPSLRGDIDCDVCIVGGGLAGINTAFGLSERGQNNIIVIDQHRIGWGASSRNGGFVAKGYSAGEDSLIGKLGLDHARNLVDLTKQGRHLIQDRIARYDIDCGPLTPGVLTVSWQNRNSGFQEKIREVNDTLGLGLEYWPAERVAEHCKTKRYVDGMFSPHDFQFHSLRYIHGLAARVEERGGKIFESTRAVSITKDGYGWRVKTPQGSVRTRQVVVCCSIYSEGLDPRLERSAFPVQTFVMVTEPVAAEDLRNSINTSHAIYDTRFASDYL
jgi:gamma-glutamylputrescine oxidase